MGYAQILGSGAGREGRYTIQLDYGQTTKQAILNGLSRLIVALNAAINETQVLIAAAEVREAARRQDVEVQFAAVAAASNNLPPGSPYPELAAYKEALKQLAAELARNQPLRITLRNQQAALRDATTRSAQWRDFNPIDVRDAWCVTHYEAGAGYPATIEIPGEPALVLLAPDCRAWIPWDGSIQAATKNAAVAILTSQESSRNEELVELDEQIAVLVVEEATAAATELAAQSAYAANPSTLTQSNWQAAISVHSAKQSELQAHRARRETVAKQVEEIQSQLSAWSSRRGADEPRYGDGYLVGREVMSPAQAYYNAALLPGWQAFKPTYRWATIDSINWDDDECDVTLAAAVSSANNLSINGGRSTLTGVPITYMTCNARCFSLDERVVVQFESQSWDRPRVIGYLDNPRKCPPTFGGFGNVPDFAFCGGVTFDVQILTHSYFSGGVPPLHYEVIGSLPSGLTIDSATGAITGDPAFVDDELAEYTLKVRCSDVHYVEGSNRRYDETNEFTIGIHGGYTIHRHVDLGTGTALNISGAGVITCRFTYSTSGGTGVITFSGYGEDMFFTEYTGMPVSHAITENPNGSACLDGLSWKHRVTWEGTGYGTIGPALFGRQVLSGIVPDPTPETNAWVSGFPTAVGWQLRTAGTADLTSTASGKFTVDIAIGDEEHIVSTITGVVGLTLLGLDDIE